MRLLLDVHHSPLAASRLRALGHDVIPASAEPGLASLDDEDLLQVATDGGRVLVTQNARDFDRIIRAWAATARHHGGVIFTSPGRFHRGGTAYPTNLVNALSKVLDNPPSEVLDWTHWLD
ncbi:MAG TPA: DUF5615 family PIN-like protein [Acidimicrobiales bacterium]|nr:DUF5615 family PIN-like protein [Acidimicrobiales bacterium]